MKLAQEPTQECPQLPLGGPEFLATDQRLERCHELAKQGFLVARVVQLTASDAATRQPELEAGADVAASGNLPLPGRLRAAVEGAIEIALSLRGAPPSDGEEELDLRTAALDKIARAMAVDAPGVCVVMPPLERMTHHDGVLELADSELLRIYGELTVEHPLVLLFDDSDRHVHALAPQSLPSVLSAVVDGPSGGSVAASGALEGSPDDPFDDGPFGAAGERRIEAADGAVEPVDFADRETLTDAVTAADGAGGADVDPATTSDDGAAAAPLGSDPFAAHHASTLGRLFSELVTEEEDGGIPFSEPPPLDPEEPAEQATQAASPTTPPEGGLFAITLDEEAPDSALEADDHDPSPRGDELHASAAMALPTEGDTAAESAAASSQPNERGSTPPRPPRRAYRSGATLDADTCGRYARELAESDGPQPVRTIEQLFQTRYVPLLEVLSGGLKHEAARQAVTRFRKSFEKSYSEGYTTMRLTGKRPLMVLDAPDLAVRIGRLNGARAVQLLLVDGMRFDLGQRVAGLLKHRLGGHAVCVDQSLLWAALPTITPTQLRLLARGPRGLREGDPASEREPMIRRGRSLTTLRRVRIGRRDLLKLDVVEARLREAGEAFEDRMALLSDEVSAVVAQFAASLSPRTLLYVFGDHGFRLEPTPADGVVGGTQPASQGGASPEEVLVPAYGWLVGKVH